MTKDEFFAEVRMNAERQASPICKDITCTECPFESLDCFEEAFYFMLKAFDELKEKYDEVVYNVDHEDIQK